MRRRLLESVAMAGVYVVTGLLVMVGKVAEWAQDRRTR